MGDLWRITATTHDETQYAPTAAAEQQYLESHGGREPGAEAKSVDPIRNRDPRNTGSLQGHPPSPFGGLTVHLGHLKTGKLEVGAKLLATVDDERRAGIRRAHSAERVQFVDKDAVASRAIVSVSL